MAARGGVGRRSLALGSVLQLRDDGAIFMNSRAVFDCHPTSVPTMCCTITSTGRLFTAQCGAGHRAFRREARCLVDRPPVYQHYTCVPGGTSDGRIDPDFTWPRAIHEPPHQQHFRGFPFNIPTPEKKNTGGQSGRLGARSPVATA